MAAATAGAPAAQAWARRLRLLAALLPAAAGAAAAQECTAQGLPCQWPLEYNGVNHTSCIPGFAPGAPAWCSATGNYRKYAYCGACPKGCTKATKRQASLCQLDFTGGYETMVMGHKVPIPSFEKYWSYLSCLETHCLDVDPVSDRFLGRLQAEIRRFFPGADLRCGAVIGSHARGRSCESAVSRFPGLGKVLPFELANGTTVGHFCRRTCGCGSCCGATSPCPLHPKRPPAAPAKAPSALRAKALPLSRARAPAAAAAGAAGKGPAAGALAAAAAALGALAAGA